MTSSPVTVNKPRALRPGATLAIISPASAAKPDLVHRGIAHLQSLGYKAGDFPESERAAAEVLALPMYPELREDEQDIVVDAIRRHFN